jgi:preprotein translocase subunit SecE
MQSKTMKKDSPAEGFRRFFRNVTAELKKVNWPNRKELTTYTIVVILTVIVVSLIIWVWDVGLTVIFKSMGFYR